MCGLFVELGPQALSSPIQDNRFWNILNSRGPDEIGCTRIAGGHAIQSRLNISGNSAGSQPLTSDCGRFVLLFNGEIYNFDALNTNLSLIKDATKVCDTTVLMAGIIRYGESFFSKLIGMFAIVFIDKLEMKVTFCRDRYGIKPLFLFQDAGSNAIILSSQQRLILSRFSNECVASEKGAQHFLRYGYVGQSPIMENCETVEPGKVYEYSFGNKIVFLKVSQISRGCDRSDLPVSERLLRSVDLHTRDNQLYTLFLSGGIDSTAIAHAIREIGGRRVHAVSILGATNQRDVLRAKDVSRYLGINHSIIQARDLITDAVSDEFSFAMDQPSIDGLNVFLASKVANSLDSKVSLTGLGADEFFGGYEFYHASYLKLVRCLSVIPGVRAPSLMYEIGAAKRRIGWRSKLTEFSLFKDRLPRAPVSIGVNDRNLFDVMSYLRHQLLADADWASMASSVELRVPFVSDVCLVGGDEERHSEFESRKKCILAGLPKKLREIVGERKQDGFVVTNRNVTRKLNENLDAYLARWF